MALYAHISKLRRKATCVQLLENKKNMGITRALKRGLDLCRGCHVAFLDNGDYWESMLLEKIIAKAEEASTDIIFCSYAIADMHGNKLCNDFMVPDSTDFEGSIICSGSPALWS